MTRLPFHIVQVILLLNLALSGFGFWVDNSAMAGTRIETDPKGFLGIPWGDSLKDRKEFTQIDSIDIVRVFALREGSPELSGIPMESMKLYTFDGKYARATFHYRGDHIHESLMAYLEHDFGKTDVAQGGMTRGLNQQYTWRGAETEISLTYHGYRERGFLSVESRVLAPLFFHAFPDQAY